MTQHSLLITLALIACTGTAPAQTTPPAPTTGTTLTIAQLFEQVEAGSRSIRAAKTSTDMAQQDIAHARSQRLPDINADLSVSYLGNALLSNRHFGDIHGLHSPHLGNSFALEAQQVIYSGGALTAGVNLAQLGQHQAETNVRQVRQQARFEALGQYLDLYKTDNRIRVYEQNIALTRRLLDEIKLRQQQGMALKNDITRYEMQMEQLQLGLTQLRNTRAILNHQLCNTLSLPGTTQLYPDTTVAAEVCPKQGEAYWQQVATTTAPVMEQQQIGVSMAQQNEKLARAARLPKVAVVAANQFNGPITFELPPINKNLNIWYVGVGVRYSLSALFKTNHHITQTQLATLRAQQDMAVAAEQLNNRTNQAYTLYLQTYTELATQRKSVELARQNYEVINARYLGQMVLVTDMIDAANLRLNAELQEVDARIGIVYAYYRMRFIAGNI